MIYASFHIDEICGTTTEWYHNRFRFVKCDSFKKIFFTEAMELIPEA